jgi:hypothetical protein
MYEISWMLLSPDEAAALISDHPYLYAQPKLPQSSLFHAPLTAVIAYGVWTVLILHTISAMLFAEQRAPLVSRLPVCTLHPTTMQFQIELPPLFFLMLVVFLRLCPILCDGFPILLQTLFANILHLFVFIFLCHSKQLQHSGQPLLRWRCSVRQYLLPKP